MSPWIPTRLSSSNANRVRRGGTSFDFTSRRWRGKPPDTIHGLSFRAKRPQSTNMPNRATFENMDELPFVVDVYRRRPDQSSATSSDTSSIPYLSLYTGRGCRLEVTFLPWPQTVGATATARAASTTSSPRSPPLPLLPPGAGVLLDDDTPHRRSATRGGARRRLGKHTSPGRATPRRTFRTAR